MEKRKGKWWLLGALAAVLIAGAVGLWLYFSPKLVLASALPTLFSKLEERFQDDPILQLLQYSDSEGKYTLDMVMRGEGDLSGPVTYDLVAQTDASAHRFSAEGTVSTSERSVELGLYMDSDFVAVSSEQLVQGAYYGITFESFASDVRQISLLSLVSDEVLEKWEASLKSLQERVSRNYPALTLPKFPSEDTNLKALLLGVAALPCTRENVSLDINSETLSCKRLDYTLGGEQLNAILTGVTGETCSEEAEVSVTFYLWEKNVVKIDFRYQEGEKAITCDFTCGKDAGSDLLTLDYASAGEGESQSFTATVATKRTNTLLEEEWTYSSPENGEISCSYQWEPTTGGMRLMVDDMTEACALQLAEIESGFQIITSDMAPLVEAVFQDEEMAERFRSNSCVAEVRRGSQIETPTYKNIDQWSLKDLLLLLNGIGKLAGVSTQ